MNTYHKAFSLIFFLTLFTACKHSSTQADFEASEKSHLKRPLWLGVEEDELRESHELVTYRFKKDFVVELPLGLQQAQEASLSEFRREILRSHLDTLLKSTPCFSNLDSKIEFQQDINNLALREIREGAVKDIYFEGGWKELANRSKQMFYEISVLLEVPLSAYDSIRDEIRGFALKDPNLSKCL